MSRLDVATRMTPPNEVEIFNAALELEDPEARDRYLGAVCGGNAALRQRIVGLLEAYSRSSDNLGRLSPEVRGRARALATPLAPSVRMGPYLLQRPIGEGGWGVVWEAMQEGPIRRQVALKVVRPGLDSRAVLARFDAERAALARMDHPHIAKVLDGGVTGGDQSEVRSSESEGCPKSEIPSDRPRPFAPQPSGHYPHSINWLEGYDVSS